jgi:manganese-dependent ADP-ribose/CDP-alcohol diphosphatase
LLCVLLLLLQEKNSPEGLVGVARRFVKFGGGVSDVQLEWLEQQLQVRA